MTQQIINTGIQGNDGTGDSIRDSFNKVNNNFSELYAVFGLGGKLTLSGLGDGTTYTSNQIITSNATGTSLAARTLTNSDGNLAITYTANTIDIKATASKLIDDTSPTLIQNINANSLYTIGNIVDPSASLVTAFNAVYSGAPTTIGRLPVSVNYGVSNFIAATASNLTNVNQTLVPPVAGTYTVTAAVKSRAQPLVPQASDADYDATLTSNYLSTEVMQRKDVVYRGGDTMTGALTLSDHPAPLAGFGTPKSNEDLQAATKYYVDNNTYYSSVNLYVSTTGDDNQTLTPAGRQGRAWQYAYKTISAACLEADSLVSLSQLEPGPYRQTITYTQNAIQTQSVISSSPSLGATGNNGNPAYTSAYTLLYGNNRKFIQTETIAYINQKYVNKFSSTGFYEVLNNITQGIGYDVILGSNFNTITYVTSLFNQSSVNQNIITNQLAQITDAVDQIQKQIASYSYDTPLLKQYITQIISALENDLLLGTNFQTTVAGLNFGHYGIGVTAAEMVFALNQLEATILQTIGTSTGQKALLDPYFTNLEAIIQTGTSSTPTFPSTGSTTVEQTDAKSLLLNNIQFIQAEIVAYLTSKYPTLSYNRATCQRDVKYIVWALVYDLLYGGNSQSVYAGLQYWAASYNVNTFQDQEKSATIASVIYLKTLVQNILTNTPLGTNNTVLYQTTVPQYTNQTLNHVVANDTLSNGVIANITVMQSIVSSSSEAVAATTYSLATPTLQTSGTIFNYIQQFNPSAWALAADTQIKAQYSIINNDSLTSKVSSLFTAVNQILTYGVGTASIPITGTSASAFSTNNVYNLYVGQPITFAQAWGGSVNVAGTDSSTYYIYSIDSVANTFTVSTTNPLGGTSTPISLIQTSGSGTAKIWNRPTPYMPSQTYSTYGNAAAGILANLQFLAEDAYLYATINHGGFVPAEGITAFKNSVVYLAEAVAFDLAASTATVAATSASWYAAKQIMLNFTKGGAENSIWYGGVNTVIARLLDSITKCSEDNPVTPQLGATLAQTFSGSFDTPHAFAAGAITTLFSGTIEPIISGNTIVPTYPSLNTYVTTNAQLYAATQIVINQSSTIANNILAYMETTYPGGFSYNQATCYRDVGYIVDAITIDLLTGGTYQSINAGKSYFKNASAATVAVGTQYTETLDGLKYAEKLAIQVLNQVQALRYQTQAQQYPSSFNSGLGAASGATSQLITLYETMLGIIVNGVGSAPTPSFGTGLWTITFSNGGRGYVDQGSPGDVHILPGQILIGNTSGAQGVIVSYNQGTLSSYDTIVVQLTQPGYFVTGETLDFGATTTSLQITIYVESGIYYEDFPIKLPPNCTIAGDDFRRTLVRPANRISQSPWVNTFFYRDAVIDNLLTGQINFPSLGRGGIDYAVSANTSLTLSATSGSITGILGSGTAPNSWVGLILTDAIALFTGYITNDGTLTTLTISSITSGVITGANNGFTSTPSTPNFVGQYITGAGIPAGTYITGTTAGGSTVQTGTSTTWYLNNLLSVGSSGAPVNLIANTGLAQVTNVSGNVIYATVLQGYPFNSADANPNVLANGNWHLFGGLPYGYHYLTDPQNPYSTPLNNKNIDMFLVNDATRVRLISGQGHGGFMMVLDPNGQIKAKSPYAQESGCFSGSTNQPRFAGGQFIDGFAGRLQGSITAVNAVNGVAGISLTFTGTQNSGLDVRAPQVPCSFFVQGNRYQVNEVLSYNQSVTQVSLSYLSGGASGSTTIVVSALTQTVVVNGVQVTYGPPKAGMLVSGNGIPAYTYISPLWDGSTTILLTAALNAQAAGTYSFAVPQSVLVLDASTPFNPFASFGNTYSTISTTLGSIIDAVAYDLALGTNYQSTKMGLTLLAPQNYPTGLALSSTSQAITYIGSLIGGLTAPTVGSGNLATVKTNLAITANILNNGLSYVPTINWPTVTGAYTLTNQLAVKNILQANKAFIQQEITAWISNNFNVSANAAYSSIKSQRDIGYIIDALTYDIVYNNASNNSNSMMYDIAQTFYGSGTSQLQIVIGNNTVSVQTICLASYVKLNQILQSIVINQAITPTNGNNLVQNTSYTYTVGSTPTTEQTRIANLISYLIDYVSDGSFNWSSVATVTAGSTVLNNVSWIPGLSVGTRTYISGTGIPNGAYITALNGPSITITGASASSNIATLTYAIQPTVPFTVGGTLSVTGITPNAYNVTATVISATTTQVTYALSSTPANGSAFGSAVNNYATNLGGPITINTAATVGSPSTNSNNIDGTTITFTGGNLTSINTLGRYSPYVSLTDFTTIEAQKSAMIGTYSSASFTGYISGSTLYVTNVVSGTITAKMVISGNGIISGTTISANLTGSGSTGASTWTVTNSQVVGSSGSTINILASTSTGLIGFMDQGGALTVPIEMGGNRSMLANDYTQVNDLGYGVLATNNGLTEQVSTFTYYNHTAYWALNGAQIRSVAGSNSNGDYGLRATGYDLTQIPNVVTLASNQVQTARVYKQGATAGYMAPTATAPALSVWISGYQYTPFNNSEIEIDHTLAGGGITRYSVANVQHAGIQINGQDVLQLSFSTAGTGGTSTSGLQYALYDGQLVTIRALQNQKVFNVATVHPTRPSTSFQYSNNLAAVYRVIAYNLTESTGETLTQLTTGATATYVSPTSNANSTAVFRVTVVSGTIQPGQVVTGVGFSGNPTVYSVSYISGSDYAVTLTSSIPSQPVVNETVTFQNVVQTTAIIQTDSSFNYYQLATDPQSVSCADPTAYTTGYASGSVVSGATNSYTLTVNGVTGSITTGMTIGGLGFTNQTVTSINGGPSGGTWTLTLSAYPALAPVGFVYFATKTQGSLVGDNKIAISPLSQSITISQLNTGTYITTWNGRVHRVISYTAPVLVATGSYVSGGVSASPTLIVSGVSGTIVPSVPSLNQYTYVQGTGFNGQYVTAVSGPNGSGQYTITLAGYGSAAAYGTGTTAGTTLYFGTAQQSYVTIDPNALYNLAGANTAASALTFASAQYTVNNTSYEYVTYNVPNTQSISNTTPSLPPVDSYVTISGQSTSAYNGTYQVVGNTNQTTFTVGTLTNLQVGMILSSSTTLTASGFTVSGGTATLTYATQSYAPFLVGSTITLSGFSPSQTSGTVNTVNSTFVVATCSTTQVTFALTGTYSVTTLGTVTGSSAIVPTNCIVQSTNSTNGVNTFVASPACWAPVGSSITATFPLTVVSITVSPLGNSGYATAPTLTFSGGGVDSTHGIFAQAYAVVDPTSQTITSVVVVSGGYGYTSTPTVTASYGNASFVVTMSTVSSYTGTILGSSNSTQVTVGYPKALAEVTNASPNGVVTSLAYTGNLLTVTSTANLIVGNQIIFTLPTSSTSQAGNIVSGVPATSTTAATVGTTYYIQKIVSSTQFTISTTQFASDANQFVPVSSAIGTLTGLSLNWVATNFTFGGSNSFNGYAVSGASVSSSGSGSYNVTFTVASMNVVYGSYYRVWNSTNPLFNGTWPCTSSTASGVTSIILTYPSNPGSFTGTANLSVEATTSSSSTLGISKPFGATTSALKIGYPAASTGQIIVNISTCRATGHDFLLIGTGGYNTSNYPNTIFGAPAISAKPANQIVEETVGRVFYMSTDENGIFRVGKYFTVDQGTGTVTFSASIALSNLTGLGFKQGVTITEFSNDASMSQDSDFVVPTQTAVIGYINDRLGITNTGAATTASNLIGFGFMSLGGGLAMKANMNLGTHKITNLGSPTDGTDAATKSYVDAIGYLGGLKDVELTTPAAGNLLIYDTTTGVATATAQTTNYINVSTTTNLMVGDTITFTTGSINNSGLTAGTYYITNVNSGSGQIKVSATLNGSDVILSNSTGTGNLAFISTRWRNVALPQGTNPVVTVTGASGDGTTATLTYAAPSNQFVVGQTIIINGMVSATGNYNGIAQVTASSYNSGSGLGQVSYANTTTASPTTFGTVIGNNVNWTYESASATLTTAINSNSIVDSMINSAAAIQQSKLLMQYATASTSTARTGFTQSNAGLAEFNSNIFTSAYGWISLRDSADTTTGIQPGKLTYQGQGTLIGNLGTVDGTAGGNAAPVNTVRFNDVVIYGNAITNDKFASGATINPGIMYISSTTGGNGTTGYNGATPTGFHTSYGTLTYSTIHGASTIPYSQASNGSNPGFIDVTGLQISGSNAISYNSTGSVFNYTAPGQYTWATVSGSGTGGSTTLGGGSGSTMTIGTSSNITLGSGGNIDTSGGNLFVNAIVAGSGFTTNTNGAAKFWGNFSLQGSSTLIATYSADLAEYYEGDAEYEVGTVVVFGGDKEITVTDQMNDTRLAGVVSHTEKAAFVMYDECPGLKNLVALAGRVPVKVVGRVKKGDMLTTAATPGYAVRATTPTLGAIIGKALEDKDYGEAGIIEVAVGRN
jgi:hypothetical protein